MTPCNGYPADRCVEPYLLGTLPELEANSFEDHYFDCPICLARVEALQSATRALGQEPLPAVERVVRWPSRAIASAGIAAALLLGVFGFLHLRARRDAASEAVTVQTLDTTLHTPSISPPAQPTTSSIRSGVVDNKGLVNLASLADRSLLPFHVVQLRGADDDASFAAGMRAYVRNDCRSAVKLLALVPEDEPAKLAASFYSGICEMHEGNGDAAVAALDRVADAGDSPQQEAAVYYLGQLALASEDEARARQFLARTISLRGDFAQRAQSELLKLDERDKKQASR